MTQSDSPYTPNFFRGNAQSAMRSARPVLQILFDLYSPESVVDIGCGSGGWLAAAEQLGAKIVRGYDGPWADPATYTSPTIDFTPVDLEKSDFQHDRRYDLAMSVEVAEHLSESRADFMVDILCAGSDVVLFGAAAPHQGGVHHVHEMPATYWIEKFRKRDYEPFDIIRPAVWDNEKIPYWFKQNTILYLKNGSDVLDRTVLRGMEGHIWDVVHPTNFEKKAVKMREAQRQLKQMQKQSRPTSDQPAKRDESRSQGRSRTTSLAKVPAPLRPVATRAWRALPESTRDKLRGRGRQ